MFQLCIADFKAYCAILVRRSNFHHQASPRVSSRESTQRRKVELWARNVRQFCLNADLHVTCRKATTGDRLLYFPSERRRGEDFFALKIRRLRPGVNPRTWVPKASTLTRHHRSRLPLHIIARLRVSGAVHSSPIYYHVASRNNLVFHLHNSEFNSYPPATVNK
jgi:hypothetical protein